MAYNEALVLAGGVAHVPILITILKFVDNKTSSRHNSKKQAETLAKKKALEKSEAAKAAAESQKKAKAAAAAKAAAKTDEIQTEPPTD